MKDLFKDEYLTSQQDGAETISRGFGLRNCDLRHRLISTQIASAFGSNWKLKPIAHDKQVLEKFFG